MNPLLILMHDTAKSLLFIDTCVELMKKRLDEVSIGDEKIDSWLLSIQKNRIKIANDLDKYYKMVKENEN